MAECYNPYESLNTQEGSWLKSNFHIHCESHPEVPMLPAETVFSYYKDAEYDILMHSVQRAYEDTSGIGEALGIRTINGQEYVVHDGILLIGTKKFLEGTEQEVVDQCIADGGFAILCHPNQRECDYPGLPPVFTWDMLRAVKGPVGIEIYNGCLSRRNFFGGLPLGFGLGTDFWDDRLSAGVLLWGFGNDDAHQPFEINVGWSHIYAKSNSFEDIKEACRRGSVYASNGLYLHDYRFDGSTITLTADFRYDRIRKIRYTFIGKDGKVLDEQRGETGTYTLQGDEMYVRVEAQAPDGNMLWTQPVVNRDCYDIP